MFEYSTIEEALDELRHGKIILVTDDPDRENEGDFICAAQFATTENVNFMAAHGKGLICMPMSTALCQKLQFPKWSATTRITMRQLSRSPLTMWIRPPAFQRQSGVSPP